MAYKNVGSHKLYALRRCEGVAKKARGPGVVKRCERKLGDESSFGGTSAKKGRGEKGGPNSLGRTSEHLSPRTPWPRILEHVYKRAMRERSIV